MAIRSKSDKRFDRSSPVARYWLTQCEGFRVQGPVSGTVEEVLGSVDMQSAQTLVVRRAWRRRNVPVAAVDAVVPAARLIVVEGLESASAARHRQVQAVVATIAVKGVPVGRFLVDATRALVLLVIAVLIALARTLRTSTRALAATCALLLEDARVRRRAAAEIRRRATTTRGAGEGRRLTRAAVLGVDGSRRRVSSCRGSSSATTDRRAAGELSTAGSQKRGPRTGASPS